MSLTGTIEQSEGTGKLATPYVKRANGFAPIKYKPSVCNFSAGMLASTLDDMGRYVSGLMENRFPRSSSFGWLWFTRPDLPNHTPNPWAFGWGHKSRGHGLPERDTMNGGLPGVSSSVIVCPNDRLAIVALSNVRSKAIASIAPQALRIIYNQAPGADAAREGEADQLDQAR
jgi:CubicO group peptidase (beta-lactamase class C family)